MTAIGYNNYIDSYDLGKNLHLIHKTFFLFTILVEMEKRNINPANMGPIWGVQPGLAWVPYGLAHMRVAQMGPIWVPYNSPIKKKEML